MIPFRFFIAEESGSIEEQEWLQLLHLFKILRLQKVFLLLDPRQFNNLIKQYYKSKMMRYLKHLEQTQTPSFTRVEDHNYIMRQIVMNYAFRVLRIVIVIFSISYFIGTLFYIIVWQTSDRTTTDNFFVAYGFDVMKQNN